MRTFGVPFSFVSSPETEKERVLYASSSVASGFYPRHDFLVSPIPINRYAKKCIVLPQILKDVSKNYWQDAAKAGSTMPLVLSELMKNELINVVLEPVDERKINYFKNEWEKVKNDCWRALNIYFKKEIKYIKNVEVRITKIGSIGSHYLLKKEKGQNLIINIREDAGVEEIINLLILALIYPTAKDLNLSFSQRMVLRDFILTRPEFGITNNYKRVKITTRLREKSDDYIKFLNIPNIIDPFTEINKNISVFGVKESILLQELIDKKDEIVDYDQIADLIWGEGRFKSYWAINKLVQRIQKKIDGLNINLKI